MAFDWELLPQLADIAKDKMGVMAERTGPALTSLMPSLARAGKWTQRGTALGVPLTFAEAGKYLSDVSRQNPNVNPLNMPGMAGDANRAAEVLGGVRPVTPKIQMPPPISASNAGLPSYDTPSEMKAASGVTQRLFRENVPPSLMPPPPTAQAPEAAPRMGVGESDDAFWRRKQMEWNRLDAQRAVDRAMAGRGDVMSLWKDAIKTAGIGSTTGGIKLARQAQNAIQLLNHLLDAQGKQEANAIAAAEGLYGRDIAGFGAESADRYHQAMTDIAGKKLPTEIDLAKSHKGYYDALAQGVPTKEEAKKLALDASAKEAILKQANLAVSNGLYPDLDTAVYEETKRWGDIESGMKGVAPVPQSKLWEDLKNDPVGRAEFLKQARTNPKIAAWIEQNRDKLDKLK